MHAVATTLNNRAAQLLLRLLGRVLRFFSDADPNADEWREIQLLPPWWRLEFPARAAQRGVSLQRRVREAECARRRYERLLSWRVLDSLSRSDTHSHAA